jgi:hypothetical protein
MLTQNGQDDIETLSGASSAARPATKEKRPAFLKLAWWAGLAVAVGVVAMFIIDHFSQVSRLREAAANIKPGDTRASVVARLGQPPVEYGRGFPPQGGPASVLGVSYGGPFNFFRATCDHWVYRALDGLPKWYYQYVGQDVTDWPVVIEFDQSGTVTTVKR